MIDFHCHLDLFNDPMKMLAEVVKRNTEILAVTTSPRAFISTSRHFAGISNVRVALGFHPELVAQRASEKALFYSQMANARYLGEIGIDGSSRNKGSIAEQKEFFNGVIHTAAVCGGKVLSIHSRGAVKDVLQILEKNKGDYIPILHWFTGSVAEAEKALELGCWFSINPNMCFSINGQNIIRCLPFDRLLPETDTPFVQNKNEPYMPWDNTVASYLAELNKTELIRINELFLSNLNHIDAFACKHI